MNRDSMKALRLDRRLLNRRGWITQADLDKQLSALPDVADKVQVVEATPESPAPDASDTDGPESTSGF